MIQTDCFAYRTFSNNNNPACGCLKDLLCAKQECPFYKSKEQRNKNLSIYGDGFNYIPGTNSLDGWWKKLQSNNYISYDVASNNYYKYLQKKNNSKCYNMKNGVIAYK